MFGEEVEIFQPKSNILRASDGKWLIENAFRIEQDVYSVYTGDGTNTTFKLAQIAGLSDISVYVDGTLQYLNYSVRKESRKLIFDTAPTNGSEIKVLYDNFEFSLLNNRQLVGATSGATAVIERTAQKTINSVPIFEIGRAHV